MESLPSAIRRLAVRLPTLPFPSPRHGILVLDSNDISVVANIVRHRKGDTELRDKLNAAIDAIRANGKYKEIQDKYFDFDVYGG